MGENHAKKSGQDIAHPDLFVCSFQFKFNPVSRGVWWEDIP